MLTSPESHKLMTEFVPAIPVMDCIISGGISVSIILKVSLVKNQEFVCRLFADWIDRAERKKKGRPGRPFALAFAIDPRYMAVSG
jgi:hypothetical protein